MNSILDILWFICDIFISKDDKKEKPNKILKSIIAIIIVILFIVFVISEIIIIKMLVGGYNKNLFAAAFILGLFIIYMIYEVTTSLYQNYEINKIKKQVKEDKHE